MYFLLKNGDFPMSYWFSGVYPQQKSKFLDSLKETFPRLELVISHLPEKLGIEVEIIPQLPLFKSKNFPTDPQEFMKEFLSFGGLGMFGVCSRGMLGFP